MFWLQIAANGVFCCYKNSCNGCLALCAAEMSAFEVNVGNEVCGNTTFAAYFRLDRVLYSFHTTPCAQKLVQSVYRLSSPVVSLFLLWKRLTTGFVIGQLSNRLWRWVFFFRKVQFFSTWKDTELQIKTPAEAFRKFLKTWCEHSLNVYKCLYDSHLVTHSLLRKDVWSVTPNRFLWMIHD